MKCFVVLAAVLACACAKPQFIAHPALGHGFGFGHAGLGFAAAPTFFNAAPAVAAAPAVVAAAPAVVAAPAIVAPAFTKTQYHAQDELGQASHGYAYPGQAHAEVRDAFGGVRGSYAYIDPNGKENRVNYIADAVNGFRVEANNLPVGPSADATPIVAAPAVIAPVGIQETPEVIEARAAHAIAFQAAAAAAAAAPERKKRALEFAAPALTYAAHPYAAYGYGYGYHAAAAPVAVAAAPALREATLTTIVNTPGHAVSYRVD